MSGDHSNFRSERLKRIIAEFIEAISSGKGPDRDDLTMSSDSGVTTTLSELSGIRPEVPKNHGG